MQRLTDNGFIFEILPKVPFNGLIGGSLSLSADTLLSDLTEKQVEALLTAHRYGYYYLPRRARAHRSGFPQHVYGATDGLGR